MVSRLIIHIGTHKTGSTAIQAALAGWHSSAPGVLYPESGRGRHAGHPHLAWESVSDGRFDEGLGGMDRLVREFEARTPEVVVISSEEFTAGDNSPKARWCVDLMNRVRPTMTQVIAYVRPQCGYLESLYAQMARNGLTGRTFEEFVRDSRGDPRFDYGAVFAPWRAAFGRSLNVFHYTEDILPHFWKVAGLGKPPRPSSRRNVRPGHKAVEMLRSIRAELAETYGIREFASLVPAFNEARAQLEQELDDTPFRALTPTLAAQLRQYFADLNTRFVAEYLEGDGFPRHDVPEPNVWELHDATVEERSAYERARATVLDQADVSG